MRLKPLNDTVIIKHDANTVYDDNPEIHRIVKEGLIHIPEKNSIIKRSEYAVVEMVGPKCKLPIYAGQRIVLRRFFDEKKDSYFEYDGEQYRFILEHYITGLEIAMKIKPVKRNILVKIFQKDEVTQGGIILPDTAKEEKHQGTVVALADDVKEDVKEGDTVIFGKYAGEEIMIWNVKHKMISVDDVLAVLE